MKYSLLLSEVKNSSWFQVQVKTMDGTRIGIDFKGTATLADLKGLLHKNLGLPKDVQRFALIGQLLDDDREG